MTPPVRYFAAELRHAREAAGLSQEQLAKEINYAQSMIAMIERCQRMPKLDFAKLVDEALGTDGRFSRMVSELLLSVEVTPTWFRPWVDHEREASEIRWYEPLVVPGLLQTEDYARMLLEDGSPDQADSLLAARMERQAVLAEASVVVLIDELVLRRQVGRPGVMRDQLHHLTTTRAVVQIVPTVAKTYRHLEGSFALALVDGAEVAYVDTPARGFVVNDPEVLSRIRGRWESIRAEALPQGQSKELILKVAETWTQQ